MIILTREVACILLVLATTAHGGATIHVASDCNTPVYFASVHPSTTAEMQTLPVSGYWETIDQINSGVSIKLAPNATGPVTQFEFTWDGHAIYYDLSNIDGNPFQAQGAILSPSVQNLTDYPTCVNVECPAGVSVCTAAYNEPDDVRTMVCPDYVRVDMTICPGTVSQHPVHRGRHLHRRHLPHGVLSIA